MNAVKGERLIVGLSDWMDCLYCLRCGADAGGEVQVVLQAAWSAERLMDCLCIIDAVVQVPGAEWHTYDMEVQVVLEAAWSAGQQTD